MHEHFKRFDLVSAEYLSCTQLTVEMGDSLVLPAGLVMLSFQFRMNRDSHASLEPREGRGVSEESPKKAN